jgi:serine phosphatase RsbU (regulator of sigma subunit)
VAIEWLAASRAAADPAHQGGDFFDVSSPEVDPVLGSQDVDGRLRVLVGDVMGHGLKEAALASRLAEAWGLLNEAGTPEEELLPALDEVLIASAPTSESGVAVFATACGLVLVPTPHGHHLTLRLAGHPAPLLRTKDGARYLDAPPGPPLGMRTPGLPNAWQHAATDLEPGDVLVLYTDGLLDSYAEQGSDGSAELARAVAAIDRGAGADAWAATLISSAQRAASDDSLVLVLTTTES